MKRISSDEGQASILWSAEVLVPSDERYLYHQILPKSARPTAGVTISRVKEFNALLRG
jgi:hypothetical protein